MTITRFKLNKFFILFFFFRWRNCVGNWMHCKWINEWRVNGQSDNVWDAAQNYWWLGAIFHHDFSSLVFFFLLLRSSTSQIMIFNSHFHRNDFVHFALFFFHFCYQFILSHIRAHTHRRSFLHSEVASDSFTHTNARTYAHYHTFKSINRVWKKNEVFSHWNDFPFISFSFSFGYIWILLTEANE